MDNRCSGTQALVHTRNASGDTPRTREGGSGSLAPDIQSSFSLSDRGCPFAALSVADPCFSSLGEGTQGVPRGTHRLPQGLLLEASRGLDRWE